MGVTCAFNLSLSYAYSKAHMVKNFAKVSEYRVNIWQRFGHDLVFGELKGHAQGSVKWMTCPKDTITEYPGLAYICQLEELTITKRIDSVHQIIGKKGIAYTVFNNVGEKVFLAVQHKKFRKFDVSVFNYYGNEVIQVKKPFRLFLDSVFVWAPPGNLVGTVEKAKPCVNNTFLVKNCEGNEVLKITAQSLFSFEYNVTSESSKVGTISNVRDRKSTIIGKQPVAVTFPADMNVKTKAVLVGACFLIGFLKY